MANNRKEAFVFADQRCGSQLWKLMWTDTTHCVFAKICRSKSKHLRLHLFRLIDWMSLWPQETVQLVTQRARNALHGQCETARLAPLTQSGLINMKWLRGKNLVNTLGRNNEAHNYNVQMQVRELEHEADARFSQRQRELLSRFPQEAHQALENQREMWGTEVTSWKRRRIVADYG